MRGFSNKLRDLSKGLFWSALLTNVVSRSNLRPTYQLWPTTNKVETILIPQITLGTFDSLFHQLDEYITQIRDVNITPGAFSLAYLEGLSLLDRHSGDFWNLNTALVTGTSTLSVDYGRKDNRSLNASNIEQEAVNDTLVGVLSDDIPNLVNIVNVPIDLSGSLAEGLVHDIWD